MFYWQPLIVPVDHAAGEMRDLGEARFFHLTRYHGVIAWSAHCAYRLFRSASYYSIDLRPAIL
jgi:hypothetical protein